MTATGPAEPSGGAGPGRAFAAGLSRHPDPAAAVGEVVGQVAEGLAGPASVAVLFVSGGHIGALDAIVGAVDSLLEPNVLIGTTAVGVVGGGEEIEAGEAISLWAASGIAAEPIRMESLPGNPPLLVGLPETFEPGSTLLTLADPYTFPVDALVDDLNERFPGTGLVGGLASAPGGPERNRLINGTTIHLDGAVGLVLAPGVATPIVSQGCRPIGSPWVITEADGQMVRQLGGRPAMDRLTSVIEGLTPQDRQIATRGLHVGLVADEQQAEFDQGDFLIRGVLGAERASGSVAVGESVELGQILQFQVRDSDSATAELERLLEPADGRSALVFTCNGRGTHLFPEPNHDATRVQETVGDAVAGMFCAGELGPIADRNAIHAFTATIVVFE